MRFQSWSGSRLHLIGILSMDFLGVGPLEFVLLLVIVFLVLGPDDLAATGKKIGRFLSTVRKSELWRGVNDVSKEIRSLPTTLMREAELEDAKKEIEKEFNNPKYKPQEFKMSDFKIPQPTLEPEDQAAPAPETTEEPENQPAAPESSLQDEENSGKTPSEEQKD